jgi:hypothetical protein
VRVLVVVVGAVVGECRRVKKSLERRTGDELPPAAELHDRDLPLGDELIGLRA